VVGFLRSKKVKRRTSIDIGTNTMLMLIADYDATQHKISTVLDIQRIPRLGKNVDKERNIMPESISKAIVILNEYKKISEENDSETIRATATSFIRDAHNKEEFISAVKSATGIEIEILSGNDEAKWTFIGGVYDKLNNGNNNITTIDIGGGSTEISTAFGFDNIRSLGAGIECKSLNIGSVRINEKFLSSHPPSYENLVLAEQFINEHLNDLDFAIDGSSLIGVAGTVTTLGAIKLELDRFEADKVDNLVINIHEIEKILGMLIPMKLEEIYLMGDYMEGRADIVIPGILILKCFMKKFVLNDVRISTKGLRYGILLRDVLEQEHLHQ
jgi:exopolyphosphatase / guanosine-5'-triphosphate,3'-diphosphate pyrophosphatase